jgi:hypothetical protein
MVRKTSKAIRFNPCRGRGKVEKWKKILGSGATSRMVDIEKFDGNFINFETSRIEILTNIQGRFWARKHAPADCEQRNSRTNRGA